MRYGEGAVLEARRRHCRTTEKIRKRLKLPRNTYIRNAIGHYNALHDRKLLERDYREASRRLGAAHLRYLRETELLDDLPDDQ